MTGNDIAGEVMRSGKYSSVDRAVVGRIITESTARYNKKKDIVKAAKKELHIIHESFLHKDCHAKAAEIIDACAGVDIKTDKKVAAALMELHSSTRERLRQAEEIYEYIGSHIKTEDHIIDLGCGFNPFALPFLGVLPATYLAYDISISTIRVLNKYFGVVQLPYTAGICDAAVEVPGLQANVLFMFKLFPILERRGKGRGFEILSDLKCSTSIISFPLESMSGKKKGMEAFYSRYFENGLPESFAILEKKSFNDEMFYIVGNRRE